MSTEQVKALLRQGIAAAKAGQTEQAKVLLMRVVELDETNVQAWLWLSSIVDDPADKFMCLYNVLELEPDNGHAQKGLAQLEQGDSTQPAPPPSPESPPRTSRYKRLSPKSTPSKSDTLPDVSRPSHLEEYPSVASALIQQKSAREPVDEESSDVASSSKSTGGAKCPFCRHRISVMAIECDHCHLPLVVDCPKCDTRIDIELADCPTCGQKMGNFRHKSVYFAELAAAYYAQEKYTNAVEYWEIVQGLRLDYPDLQLRLAEAQAKAGRPNKAIDTLKTVLEVEPGQEAATLALGGIYHNLSQWDDAEEIYREALAVSPESAQLHFAFGWLLVEHSQAEQGMSYLEDAVKLNPKHGMAWFRLGQLYDIFKKPKLAVRAHRRAVTLLPKNSLAYKRAQHKASVLEPELPHMLSTGWAEFLRQASGPFLVCVVAVLLDSGMRPWWIPLPGWGALFVGVVGIMLWVSGMSLPQNPAIRVLFGAQGLPNTAWRVSAMIIGALFWLIAMGIILYPINQSPPEVPAWILSS